VGDVRDEHDATDVDVQRLEGGWELSGLLRVDEVAEATGFTAPEGEYETLGGTVQAHLGHVPEVGDQLELHGWSLTVQRMDGRRVESVLLRPVPEHASVEDTEGGEHRG
jgi:CBS domain containing-hemolysin-like protein